MVIHARPSKFGIWHTTRRRSTLLFSLISNCSRPELNDKFTIVLDQPYPNHDDPVSVMSRGEAVSVRLNEQLQPIAVETSQRSERRRRKRPRARRARWNSCLAAIKKLADGNRTWLLGRELLVACIATESSTYGSFSRFEIHRITNTESKLLADDECGGWAGVISEKGVQPPYIALDCSSWSGMYRPLTETASTEKDAKPAEKKPEWRAEWVQIYFGPDAKNYSMRIKCDCESLGIDKLSFDPVRRLAIFELDTDARVVEIEGRSFPISSREEDPKRKADVGLYKVEFDKMGRIGGFEFAAVER